jgi:hypothetical protein
VGVFREKNGNNTHNTQNETHVVSIFIWQEFQGYFFGKSNFQVILNKISSQFKNPNNVFK